MCHAYRDMAEGRYGPFNRSPLYARVMRLILLLSALLSAFAAGVSPARAAGVSAVQVGAVIAAVAAQRDATVVGIRPLVGLPSVRDVAAAPVFAVATVGRAVPRYAGRLRV